MRAAIAPSSARLVTCLAFIAAVALGSSSSCTPAPLACDDATPCPGALVCGSDGFCAAAGDGGEGEGDAEGDAGEGDAGEGDAGEGDAGEGDAGEGDAGEGDAGEGDAGEGDAGEGDAGEGDAGEGDAGEGDAGEGDAGEGDAGEGDAGEGEGDAGEGEGELTVTLVASDDVVDNDAFVTLTITPSRLATCTLTATGLLDGIVVVVALGADTAFEQPRLMTRSEAMLVSCAPVDDSQELEEATASTTVHVRASLKDFDARLNPEPEVQWQAADAAGCELDAVAAPVEATALLAEPAGASTVTHVLACAGTSGDIASRSIVVRWSSINADGVAEENIELAAAPVNVLHTISLPTLVEAQRISVVAGADAVTVDMPALRHVTGSLTASGIDSLVALRAPALTAVDGSVVLDDNNAMTTLELGALAAIGVQFSLERNDILDDMPFLSLVRVGDDLSFLNNGIDTPVLSNIQLPALVGVGGDITLSAADSCDELEGIFCALVDPAPSGAVLVSGVDGTCSEICTAEK